MKVKFLTVFENSILLTLLGFNCPFRLLAFHPLFHSLPTPDFPVFQLRNSNFV